MRSEGRVEIGRHWGKQAGFDLRMMATCVSSLENVLTHFVCYYCEYMMRACVLVHVKAKSNFPVTLLPGCESGCSNSVHQAWLLSSPAQVWESRAETGHTIDILSFFQLLCRWGLVCFRKPRVEAEKALRSLQRSKSWWLLAGEIVFAVRRNTMWRLSFGNRDRAWVEGNARWKMSGSRWLGRLANDVFSVDCGCSLYDKNWGEGAPQGQVNWWVLFWKDGGGADSAQAKAALIFFPLSLKF